MGFKQFYTENATDNAKKSLDAIIKNLEDSDGDSSKEMLKMANGIMSYYDKNKSFAPLHAKWIYNTSKAMG